MSIFFNAETSIVVFLTTLSISILIVMSKRYHGRLSIDDTLGIQKFHNTQTPRIGGLALVFGYFVAWVIQSGEVREILGWVGVASFPVLAFGLAEDLSKSIGIATRLVATLIAGIIFSQATGYSVETVDLWQIDIFLAIPAFSIAFTAFAIGSSCNALNIIDGFHGLASGTMLLMLTMVATISWTVGDITLFQITTSIAAITLGFFLVNFPSGKIFLGDGGAYFLGFLIAALTVMLASRNPEVSPWICPLILSYPLTELVVSIARKSWLKGHHPGRPDNQHLHMLVYRFIARRVGFATESETRDHALTSLILWVFSAASLVLVLNSGYEAYFAIRSTIALFCAYLILYSLLRIFEQRIISSNRVHTKH